MKSPHNKSLIVTLDNYQVTLTVIRSKNYSQQVFKVSPEVFVLDGLLMDCR